MLKKNLLYNIALSGSQFLFPLITFPYMSRILGPAGVGKIAFVDSFTQYFILFSALGIPIYGVREIARLKGDIQARNKLFTEIILIHLLATIFFSVIYYIIAASWQELRPELHMVCIGICILFANVFSLEWYFQGINEFSYITLRTLGVRIVTTIFLFVFLKDGSSPIVYYWIFASTYLLTALVNLYLVAKHIRFGVLKHLQVKKHIKPLLVILSSTLAISVYILMDNIILGYFKDVSSVGYYSTAIKIVRIPFSLLGAMSAALIPHISQAFHEGNLSQVQELINKSFSFICLVSFPLAAGIYIGAPFLIQTFAGNDFIEATTALRIIAINVVFVGFNNLFGIQLLNTAKKETLLLRSVIIGMIVSISLNILIIPSLSYNGAAITSVITELIVTGLTFYFAKKNISFRLRYKELFMCLLMSTTFFLADYIASLTDLDFMSENILTIAISSLVYICFVLFGFDNVYINKLKGKILNKLKSSHI